MPTEKTMEDAPIHYNADSASGWSAGYNAALSAISSAAADVIAERERQMQAEGWTPEHDDTHSCGELAAAAACYAHPAPWGVRPSSVTEPPQIWPWSREWWKPKDRRANLVRAAALIVAEIERLDRAAGKAA
jgi:hypothetical protein